MAATPNTTDISRAIEIDILNGVYKSGEHLNEYKLVEKFGVSRTPIREALNKLVAEGIAEHRVRQGIFVANVSLSTVFEMFETLGVLESAAARLAARRIMRADAIHLLNAAEKTVHAAENDDVAAYTTANARFHEIIYAGSANHVLEETIKQLRRKATPYRSHIHRVAGYRPGSADEHLRIAAAINEGKEDDAAALAFRHLDLHRSEFSDFVMLLSRALES